MNTNGFFTETQRFKQWWIWILLLGMDCLFLYGIIKQAVFEQQFGNKPMSNTWLLITFGLTLLMTLLLVCCRLETRINEDGIYVRFFPLQFTHKKFSWAEVSKLYLRQYRPMAEYGGWGIRYGVNGKAYNVSGNMGLQLEFISGEKLLIGTNRPKELTETLISMGKINFGQN